MVQNVAPLLAEMEQEDFYLLSGVEQGMRVAEWVDRRELPKLSGLTAEAVTYRLDRCAKRDLIRRKTIQYEGYTLTAEGYDALALHTFAERETITGVGAPLGVGKESDVYEVESFRPMALKLHREGYTNFREVLRERDYTATHRHVSWLYTARKAAEREYEMLRMLYPAVSVPRPVDQNRHAIVMGKFDGVPLARARLDPQQVPGVFELICDEVEKTIEAGIIHNDLSEYNIAVGTSGVTIFDWPQALELGHDNARERLERDIENVVRYLRRKYPHTAPTADPALIAAELMGAEEREKPD
jgi:serine/threonine protein kinase